MNQISERNLTLEEKIMDDLLIIGRIVGTHAIKGEVNVYPLTDDPKRFSILDECFLVTETKTNKTSMRATNAKYSNNKVILKFEGIDDCDKALSIKGKYIAVTRDKAVKLPSDSYFICDLIGCVVIDDIEGRLGILHDVLQTGASDVYTIKRDGQKDLLIPAIKDVIKEIDLEGRIIKVHLLDGLLDL